MKHLLLPIALGVLLCLPLLPANAQATGEGASHVAAPQARVSPVALAQTRLDNGGYLKVVYGQPHRRDRVIFGELVPMDAVWRTGANEATEIAITSPVEMGGVEVSPGVYSLFTIPGETEWTVILNSALGLWGAYEYSEDHDVARFTVPVQQIPNRHEAFTIAFDGEGNMRNMTLTWDTTRISVPVRGL
jgi:hypothetical protein